MYNGQPPPPPGPPPHEEREGGSGEDRPFAGDFGPRPHPMHGPHGGPNMRHNAPVRDSDQENYNEGGDYGDHMPRSHPRPKFGMRGPQMRPRRKYRMLVSIQQKEDTAMSNLHHACLTTLPKYMNCWLHNP